MSTENSGDDVFEGEKKEESSQEDIAWDEPASETEPAGSDSKTAAGETRSAGFSELKKTDNISSAKNLDFILDIPLEVTVELGRTTMPIQDLLQLGQGSIVELNKIAGEPLEILINQKLIAKGEVVVVNEKFGIRLTDIISPKERVEKLG